jgi:hypothetical protein
MLRHDHEALLQGAVDGSLTPEERDALRRLLAHNADARTRAGELGQLNAFLASLGPAEAPPDLVDQVVARISPYTAARQPVSPFLRPVPMRGVTVNKKIIVGLAAAAAVILAVVTYTSYPPATEGTEATIGAAQRAQTPQIAAKDVGLGDASAQEVLQTDTWDAIMKDEDLRSTLQDAEMRRMLEDAELRQALENAEVRRFLNDPNIARRMADRDLVRQLNDAEAVKKLNEAALRQGAFLRWVRNPTFRDALARPGVAKALGGEAMHRFLRDARVTTALRSNRFAQELAATRPTR